MSPLPEDGRLRLVIQDRSVETGKRRGRDTPRRIRLQQEGTAHAPAATLRANPERGDPARALRGALRQSGTKTLPEVAAEMALSVLAYNLTRVMNIVGVKTLIAAIVV